MTIGSSHNSNGSDNSGRAKEHDDDRHRKAIYRHTQTTATMTTLTSFSTMLNNP